MDTVSFNSTEALAAYLARFAGRALFRGQSEHHTWPDGTTSLPSSFDRLGCVPLTMFKWVFHARQILRACGVDVQDPETDYTWIQGLLQHYGWRSFFVDLTSSYAVASWFAAHARRQSMTVQEASDCWSTPVLLFHDHARYEPSGGDGHLYVVSRDALDRSKAAIVNLDRPSLPATSRPRRQKGWLAGSLAQQCAGIRESEIVAHLVAPSAIFHELASRHGFTDTDSLFPGPADDPILRYFLSLPWETIGVQGGNRFTGSYVRSLKIPDYACTRTVLADENTALYDPHWMAYVRRGRRTCGPVAPAIRAAMFYMAPDGIYFTFGDTRFPCLAHVRKATERYSLIFIETEGLIRLPEDTGTPFYTKGILISRERRNTVFIGELFAQHPGTRLTGFGCSQGLRYRWVGDSLERAPCKRDCKCGAGDRHSHHLRVLDALGYCLKEKKVAPCGPLTARLTPQRAE